MAVVRLGREKKWWRHRPGQGLAPRHPHRDRHVTPDQFIHVSAFIAVMFFARIIAWKKELDRVYCNLGSEWKAACCIGSFTATSGGGRRRRIARRALAALGRRLGPGLWHGWAGHDRPIRIDRRYLDCRGEG